MFTIQRFGVVMQGLEDDPDEAMGVLNPGGVRGRDGAYYLFPRVVAANNFSRIGRAQVIFDEQGNPTGVERLGWALEPTEAYELNDHGGGGVEDPRVTFVEALDQYVMTYTAYGPFGPKIALAVSDDLQSWQRLGPVEFCYAPEYRTDFDLYPDKDALLFPVPVNDPHGRPALALLHRPSYELWRPAQPPYSLVPHGVEEERPSIWISYCPLDAVQRQISNLVLWSDHHLLAAPQEAWEALKIGGGTPPIKTHLGWLTLHHGVMGVYDEAIIQQHVYYSAGLMVLDTAEPRKVLYRSREPLFQPEGTAEQEGIVNNVVFPTAVDVRSEHEIDVYYGMADARIGALRLHLPQTLSEEL